MSIGNMVGQVYHCGMHSAENLAAVSWSVTKDPDYRFILVSIVYVMALFGAFCIKTRTIVQNSVNIRQNPRDHEQQRIYADWLLEQQEVD